MLALALLLLLASSSRLVRADCPEGCPERCPDQRSAQSEWVRQRFSLARFWGTYYELQYHDDTQPRFMSCQRSVKSPNPGGATRHGWWGHSENAASCIVHGESLVKYTK